MTTNYLFLSGESKILATIVTEKILTPTMKQILLNFPGTVSMIFFEMQIFKYMLIRLLFCSDIVQVDLCLPRDIILNKS